jgi:hypothetical protein
VGFLAFVDFGLFAAEPASGSGDLHAFAVRARRAARPLRWAAGSCSLADTRAQPMMCAVEGQL